MKIRIIYAIILIIFITSTAACNNATSSENVDTQKTIDAAILFTETTKAGMQATINAAIAQTSTASAPNATPTVYKTLPLPDWVKETLTSTTSASGATPTEYETLPLPDWAKKTQTSIAASTTPQQTPAPDYSNMSEEELTNEIDKAVNDATAASEQYATQAETYTADDTLTQEEIDDLLYLLALTEEAIYYADDLIEAYYGIYGELAVEMIELLIAIEDDLSNLADEAETINTELRTAANTLEQGLELSNDTISQIQSASQTIKEKAGKLQTGKQEWVQSVQTEIQNRITNALAVEPNNVPGNRKEAIQSALNFVEIVQSSLADNQLSFTELSQIAQLGANVTAGLNAIGNPQLAGLSTSIDSIVGQLAGGQLPQARSSIGGLQSALSSLPSLR